LGSLCVLISERTDMALAETLPFIVTIWHSPHV
jgi:hypothetical protein